MVNEVRQAAEVHRQASLQHRCMLLQTGNQLVDYAANEYICSVSCPVCSAALLHYLALLVYVKAVLCFPACQSE